jgi:hypothetical protein
MPTTIWYPSNSSTGAGVEGLPKRKRGRPKKETTMTPETNETNPTTANNEPKHSPITRKVFDLATFDEVNLTKPFVAPAKPATVNDALALVGNDSEKLLALIYEGLTAEARESQRMDPAGYVVDAEEEKDRVPYSGKFADEEKIKLIQGAVLNTAKMFAGGTWDSLKGEKGLAAKKGFKAQAIAMLRATPAALASLTGVKEETPVEAPADATGAAEPASA